LYLEGERLRLRPFAEYQRHGLVWVDRFGHCPLRRILPLDIQTWATRRRAEVEPATVNRELSFLRRVMSRCKRVVARTMNWRGTNAAPDARTRTNHEGPGRGWAIMRGSRHGDCTPQHWCHVSPRNEIDEIRKQENRSLERFDADVDLPDHLTREFPPPMLLSSRRELGDVSIPCSGSGRISTHCMATDATDLQVAK